jgi:type I restriction enzyme, S subunit
MSGQRAGKMPRIRFKGFEGEWEEKELGELADIKLGKMLDKVKHTSGQLLPYLNNISLRWNDVDTSNLPQMYFKDDELERFGLKAGDVVVCEGGEPGRSAIWDGHLPNLKFQKAIHRVRFNVPYEAPLLVLHLQNIVGTNRFEMLFTGGGIKHLTRETFSLLVVPQPSLQEQRDVAHFLSELDNLIGLHQRKHDKLVTLKKAMLQKMFPQPGTTTPEIRFKGFSGDWEQKLIGDVLTETKRPMVLEDQKLYELIVVKRRNQGVVSRGYLHGRDILVKSYSQLQTGDFLISKRQVVHGATGIVPENLNGAIVSNEYLVVVGNDRISTDFLAILSSLPDMRRKFFLSSYGVDIEKLFFDAEDWKKRTVTIPELPEQTRISRYFRTFDELISKHATQLQKLQQLKSACLEKMFV